MAETKNNDLIIHLDKPYKFEGSEHTIIDLNGLEDVTGAQLAKVENKVTALVPELTLDYALLLAAEVTGQPIEFYKSLPGKGALKVKRTVSSFLNGQE